MKTLQRGFTLIELLVVIAIIGILSSIVLASLSSARSKGEDAAIQSSLSNMRGQAELLYSNMNTYGAAPAVVGTCPSSQPTNDIFGTTTPGSLFNLVKGTTDRAGASPTFVYCNSTPSAWVVVAKLKGTGYACVDSNGTSKTNLTATSLGTITTGAASSTFPICN